MKMDLTDERGLKQCEKDMHKLLGDMGAGIQSLYYFTSQCQGRIKELEAQLEASQAREAVLAGALESIIADKGMPCLEGDPEDVSARYSYAPSADKLKEIAKQALSTTPAQAVERWKAMEAVITTIRQEMFGCSECKPVDCPDCKMISCNRKKTGSALAALDAVKDANG